MPGATPRDDALAYVASLDRCTVLVIDVQNDFCSPGGTFAHEGRNLDEIRRMLPVLAAFLQGARQAGARILYLRHEYQPALLTPLVQNRDRPLLTPLVQNRDRLLFGSLGYPAAGTWGAELCPEVAPGPGEQQLTKSFYSAFSNPELERLLAAHSTETLIVTGVLTNVCVETTLRDADTRDFYPVIVSDCVASDAPELHRATLANVAGYFGWVCTSQELLALWAGRNDNHDR
jgi:ureidoacrylate peracid hydrolase